MKSTIKIGYSSRSDSPTPQIKIIQNLETISEAFNEEADVRDQLVRDFLQRPGHVGDNIWFKVGAAYPDDPSNPKLKITTIEPVREEHLIYQFKHAILNRYIPYNDLLAINYARDTSLPEQWRDPAFNPASTGEEKPESYALYTKIEDFFTLLEKTERAQWDEQHPS